MSSLVWRVSVDCTNVEHDDLATWRSMSPGDKLRLALELSALCWRWLDVPDRATGDRKWSAWQREHDQSTEALLDALRRHGDESEPCLP